MEVRSALRVVVCQVLEGRIVERRSIHAAPTISVQFGACEARRVRETLNLHKRDTLSETAEIKQEEYEPDT